MVLAVTNTVDGKNGLINLPVEEVLFLEFDFCARAVFVHTDADKFYLAGTLTYWTDALKAKGYHFERVDRNYVVQVPKIKKLDKIFTKAYFDYDPSPSDKSITLSQKQFKQIVAQTKVFDPSIVIE